MIYIAIGMGIAGSLGFVITVVLGKIREWEGNQKC
jgi:hypothetical protein